MLSMFKIEYMKRDFNASALEECDSVFLHRQEYGDQDHVFQF
jgi:hypothetical protein